MYGQFGARAAYVSLESEALLDLFVLRIVLAQERYPLSRRMTLMTVGYCRAVLRHWPLIR
jgi:hypothetical protein